MVRRKDTKIAKTVKKEVEKEENMEVKETVEESRLHKIKRRSSGKRLVGVGLIVLVLLLGGWFATKVALTGWNFSTGSIKDIFSLNTTKLIGEDQGRVNILVLGMPGGNYDGPNLTDTIIAASMPVGEENTGKGFLFSLPRDLYVKIPGNGQAKINSVYEIGKNEEDGNGGLQTAEVASEVLGLQMPYYFKIDFSGFEQLVDELGGVVVEVDKDLFDDKYPTVSKGYETVDIKAGTYTMDGAMALKYARSRQSTSDFDRAARQQTLIMAIRAKMMELDMFKQPAKALAIFEVLSSSIETNMNPLEIKRLIDLFKDFDPTKLTNKVFDDSAAGMLYAGKVDEMYVLRPVGDDFKVISDYVAKLITGEEEIVPGEEQVATEPLKIEVLNGTITTGLAGKIAAKLKGEGYSVVLVGNNAVRGFTKTIVYDLSGGTRTWEVRKLASSLGAEVGGETITTTSGALARVVVGSEAQ
ncbi:LCP family protein [Patescibacteria group bacterium]|nr:LCP family protein [Patescibacteria group bacterium]